jgi:PD-(D/E)XK nuclease superfamily
LIVSDLELPRIRATSPTLAETMRACFLRAGLSKATGSSRFVLGNPKAWLGTAYHEVLEKIVKSGLSEDALDTVVERLWCQAIATQQRHANEHPLDARFGVAMTWPGYYVARASVALRVQSLSAEPTPAAAPTPKRVPRGKLRGHIREREFSAFDGKLIGRPDVIRDSEVVDYKSGAMFEYDEVAQAEVVKAAYVRQLRIYGFLVKETFGWWPLRGRLLPLAGAGIEIALDPTHCEREATEAVALLDDYNMKLLVGVGLGSFASPTPQCCRWCPYKLLCPPFWQIASPDWSGHLEGAAVEGVLTGAPIPIHAGAARAVSLDVHAGSEARQRAQIAPLNLVAHPSVTSLAPGERVRIVGLRVRPDGILVPSQRTVLFRVDDLPILGRS